MTPEFAGAVGNLGTLRQIAPRVSWNRSLNAVEEDKEDKGDISEEVHEDDDELHAWCLLKESENEQRQKVASKKSKLKSKKAAHESLLSVENNAVDWKSVSRRVWFFSVQSKE